MKKRSLAIVSALFLSTALVTTVSASSESDLQKDELTGCYNIKSVDSNVLFTNKQRIDDVDKLFEMAKQKEGFLNSSELKQFAGGEAYLENISSDTNGVQEKIQVETLATSELLEVYETNGVKTEVFNVTQFAVVHDENFEGKPSSNIGIQDTDYDEMWDSSISVKAYSTNTFTRSLNTCIKLTKVNGGWQRSDSQVSIGTKRVNWGATGRRCSNGSAVTQNSAFNYPSSNTWSYNVSTTWVPVDLIADTTHVGNVSRVDLTRGSSKWVLQFNNYVR